jgi:hypothetical protein
MIFNDLATGSVLDQRLSRGVVLWHEHSEGCAHVYDIFSMDMVVADN